MYSIFISIFISFFSFETSEETIDVHYNKKEETIVIRGFGGFEKNNSVSVYFGEVVKTTSQPKIIGSFTNLGTVISFKSKYGFSQGTAYTVLITIENQIQRFVVITPKSNFKPSTSIINVYPTSSQLPMNQLKFYIEFSAPMRLGNAFEHVHLYKLPEGKLESEAFLVTAEELWNPAKTRVTIFFDPGRIKRGVQPNLQLGLPLVEGYTYKLVIDEGWLDVNDVQLLNNFEKIFDVVSVDRESPDPKKWVIDFPKIKNESSINIDFKEALDFGLLHSAILIVDETNRSIEGIIHVSDNEKKWTFTPKDPWLKGNYKMIINAWLEDLSGNNLNRKFDVDLNDKKDTPKNINEVLIPFTIK